MKCGVGDNDNERENAGGREIAEAGCQPYGGRAPNGGGGIEPADETGVTPDESRAQETNASRNLRRHARSAIGSSAVLAHGNENRGPKRDERVGVKARFVSAELSFQSD